MYSSFHLSSKAEQIICDRLRVNSPKELDDMQFDATGDGRLHRSKVMQIWDSIYKHIRGSVPIKKQRMTDSADHEKRYQEAVSIKFPL
jgi:hypothetical protein